ncbi:MAG: hypothetical protein ACLFVB_07230 [Thermoplasmata archaeon]
MRARLLTEYLYNLIENEIASKGDKISNDYGILRYRGKRIRNRSELNKYSNEIKTECGKKAEEIVKDLKQDTNLTNMLEGDFGKLDEKFYDETMKEKMHELFRRWEKEDER